MPPVKENADEAATGTNTAGDNDLSKTVSELSAKLVKHETSLAHYQRDIEDLKEENTNLKRSAATKGGEKEKTEFEDHLKQDFESRYNTKFNQMESDLNNKNSEIKTLRVTNVGLQKAATLGFIPKAMPMLEREINDKCDWVDGKVVVKDGVDAQGKQKYKYSASNPNVLMGLDEFLGNLAVEHDYMVESGHVSGTKTSGTKSETNSHDKSVIKPPTGFTGWSQREQEKWMTANPESARAYMRNYSAN